MRFNLQQLTAFVAAVEQGSFSAAGRSLGKAQSAVSTAVANLELDLAVNLFDRSRREPVLTAAGQVLLPQARLVLEQARAFQGQADALAAGEEGRLVLAVEESLVGPELERLLGRFEQRFPLLELELLNPARLDVISLVTEGRADLGLMIAVFTAPEGYRITPLGEMLQSAVAGAGHPLARLERVSFDELRRHRQLLQTSRSGRGHGMDQISAQLWRVESQYGLLELAKQGLGWAWAPDHMVAGAVADGSLCRLRFEGALDHHHLPVDMITGNHYVEGIAGRWLRDALMSLSFLSRRKADA